MLGEIAHSMKKNKPDRSNILKMKKMVGEHFDTDVENFQNIKQTNKMNEFDHS